MASSTTWQNSHFTAGGDVRITTNHGYASPLGHDPFKTLRERTAPGALHDSAERPDPPKCHPQTREAVLNRIDQWARDWSVNAKPILWLTGAAGAGKSAIAQTLVEQWKEENLIIPNFFCWRTSPKRNQKTHIIPTLSFQLTKGPKTARTKIEEALKDEHILERNLKSQVQELIVGPLEDIVANGQLVVIVIDGLDEVRLDLPPDGGFPGQSYEEQQRELLEAMVHACQKIPFLRVLIASRPERQIRASFSEAPLTGLSERISLVHQANVKADITLYLKCKFAEIRQRHPGIDPSWPSSEQISLLVEKSSGQFIYPSTVVKYIFRGRQFPVKSLQNVLALQARLNKRKEHPLAELDALYEFVLLAVVPESWPVVRIILGLMCYPHVMECLPHWRCLEFSSEPGPTFLYLEEFFRLPRGELSSHLTDLHSLLFIPTSSETPSSYAPHHIRFLHATLSEYLIDPSRAGDLSIDENEVYAHCSVLLVKYIRFLLLDNPSYHPFPLSGLYMPLATFVSQSSPSAELTMLLWDFLKARIGEYNSSDVPSTEPCHRLNQDEDVSSQKDKQIGDEPNFSIGIPEDCLSWLGEEDVVLILEYLLECNTQALEPSQPHREAIDQRLREFLFRNYPEHRIALQYAEEKNRVVTGTKSQNPRTVAIITNMQYDLAGSPDTARNRAEIPEAEHLVKRGHRSSLLKRVGRWFRWGE